MKDGEEECQADGSVLVSISRVKTDAKPALIKV